MDVSMVRLSVVTRMDNRRRRRLSNAPISLFAHLWSSATQLIMNLREIRLLSIICQLDVSAAFSAQNSSPHRVKTKVVFTLLLLFSRLLNSLCRRRLWRHLYISSKHNDCSRGIRLNYPTADGTESRQRCNIWSNQPRASVHIKKPQQLRNNTGYSHWGTRGETSSSPVKPETAPCWSCPSKPAEFWKTIQQKLVSATQDKVVV